MCSIIHHVSPESRLHMKVGEESGHPSLGLSEISPASEVDHKVFLHVVHLDPTELPLGPRPQN